VGAVVGTGGTIGRSTGAGIGAAAWAVGCVSASNAFMTIDSMVLVKGKTTSGTGDDDDDEGVAKGVSLVATILERRRRLPLFLARKDLEGGVLTLPLFSALNGPLGGKPSKKPPPAAARARAAGQSTDRRIAGQPVEAEGGGDHDVAVRSQPSSRSGRLQQWRGCAHHLRAALSHGLGAEVMPKLATGLRGEETNHRTRRVAGTLFRIDIDSAIARDSSHVDRASGRRRAGATKNAPK
jgi:hypothetical protein